MGRSTDALLVYGYDLGGDEEWNVPEPEDQDEEDGEDEYGLIERVAAKLLVAAGFNEPDPDPDAPYSDGPEYRQSPHFQWYLRRSAATEALPVQVETHCSSEYPMYLLVAHVIRAWRGHPQFPDLAKLEQQRAAEDWDRKLAAAIDALGWTMEGSPRWILCSDWG